MGRLRKLSGQQVVKILCNKFRFVLTGRSGSHVRLAKKFPAGKVGCVVPIHRELKIGTLKGVLRQARISEEEFAKYQ